MPRMRRRKWVRRIMKAFCIRHSRSEENLSLQLEQKLLLELQELRFLNKRPITSFDDWEETLWLAGLAVVAPRGAVMPVLNICLGFENYELKKLDVKTYNSYCDSHWDRVINQQGFAKLACEKYPDEPVVDGLPASIWLECVEPTLSILKSLSILKHRKCNLTSKKKLRESQMDNSRSQHGDFMYGPIPPFLALPRRGVMRMEIRIGLRTEAPNLIQSSFNNRPVVRNFKRRHRERQLYKASQSENIEGRPQDSVEVQVICPVSEADPRTNSVNSCVAFCGNLMADDSERNTNQNANIRHEGVGSRPLEILPDIEVVDLDQLPPDQAFNDEHVFSRDNSRPGSPRIPEWLIYDPANPELFNDDAQDVINDIVARVVERIGVIPEQEEYAPEEADSQGYADYSSSSQSETDTDEEEDEEGKDIKYSDIFEPRPVPVQQDSEVFYHRGHLVLSDWDLRREDEKCDDRPKYVWNESHRLLEKTTSRVGPPEQASNLADILQKFFTTEAGEWKNSASGAKLMRLAVKDNNTRRHLMLAFNKVSEKKEDCGPVEFRDVKAVNKLSTLQEVPTYTPKPIPNTRRGRLRMRLRRAWSNFRFRLRMLRGRITGFYG